MCRMSDDPLLAPAVCFFARLEQDNSARFWTAHRRRYDEAVRAPFVSVLDRLTAFGPWRIYRPHNDRRFRPDADPYKTFVGAVAERADGVGAFVSVRAAGLLVGTGVPMPAPDQLARMRAAVADEASGTEVVELIDGCRRDGLAVTGGRWPPLVRPPAGHRRDHPRAELLRWKGLEVSSRVAAPSWPTVDAATAGIDALLRRPAALHDWLGRHVGPSALTAEERYAPRRR